MERLPRARLEKLSSLGLKGKKNGTARAEEEESVGKGRGWGEDAEIPYLIQSPPDRDVGFLARSSYRKLSLIKCLISSTSLLSTRSLSLSSFGWQSGGARSYPSATLHERAPIYTRLILHYYAAVCSRGSELCFSASSARCVAIMT